jgi:hypothetical protein
MSLLKKGTLRPSGRGKLEAGVAPSATFPRGSDVFVKCSRELPFTLSRVKAEMLSSPASWLQPLVVDAGAQGRLLRAEVGPAAASFGRLPLEVGLPFVSGGTASTPFHVRVEGGEPWAPFDGLLTAAWFGDWSTQLVLEGQYEQPAWMTAREQELLHRVLECVARQFLMAVAAELHERLACTSGAHTCRAPRGVEMLGRDHAGQPTR